MPIKSPWLTTLTDTHLRLQKPPNVTTLFCRRPLICFILAETLVYGLRSAYIHRHTQLTRAPNQTQGPQPAQPVFFLFLQTAKNIPLRPSSLNHHHLTVFTLAHFSSASRHNGFLRTFGYSHTDTVENVVCPPLASLPPSAAYRSLSTKTDLLPPVYLPTSITLNSPCTTSLFTIQRLAPFQHHCDPQFLLINCHSIPSNMSRLKCFVASTNPDIVRITKSCLTRK